MERIQKQAHLVVIVNQFPAQHARPNFFRLRIKCQKDRIEVFAGVSEIGFGALGSRRAIVGVTLNKLIDLEHGARQLSRRLHAFEITEFGRGRKLGNLRNCGSG